MTFSPNGERNPLNVAHESGAVECFASLTGGGASTDLTNNDSSNRGGGEIASAVWASTGTYTITFRKLWPEILFYPVASFLGAHADENLQVTAMDVTTGTATFVFNVGTVPTDLTTDITTTIRWTVLAVNKR